MDEIRQAFSLWPLVVAIADAEDRRLNPPDDVDPAMGDCLHCAATGQVLDSERTGKLVECGSCGGTGQVELDRDEIAASESEHDRDAARDMEGFDD
jgi:hypothetical protein